MFTFNNKWRNFKFEMKRSYESFSPEEWEKRRDKRHTKDECDLLIEYWATEEKQVSYLFCMFSVRSFRNFI